MKLGDGIRIKKVEKVVWIKTRLGGLLTGVSFDGLRMEIEVDGKDVKILVTDPYDELDVFEIKHPDDYKFIGLPTTKKIDSSFFSAIITAYKAKQEFQKWLKSFEKIMI